jgi:hypothetical protein
LDLERAGHWVVYYNAWANDYSKDPLASLIVEITEQIEAIVANSVKKTAKWRRFKSALKGFLNSWSASDYFRFGVAAGSSVLAFPILIPSYDPESDNVKEIAGSVEKSLGAFMESSKSYGALDRELDRRNSLRAFQLALQEITRNISSSKGVLPIYIFIDELDRCKPDFTIGLIECVKHILSIDNIYFVFATDGGQLQNAIHGAYGERFSAELYFKRVFDRDIALVEPDSIGFANALCEKYGHDFVHENCAHEDFVLSREGFISNTSKCFYAVSKLFDLSLRDQEQAFSILDGIIRARSENGGLTNVFFVTFIIVLWLKNKNLFFRLRNNSEYVKVDDFYVVEGFSPNAVVDVEYLSGYSVVKESISVWDIFDFHISFLRLDLREFKREYWELSGNREGAFIKFLSEYDKSNFSTFDTNPLLVYFDEVSLIG